MPCYVVKTKRKTLGQLVDECKAAGLDMEEPKPHERDRVVDEGGGVVFMCGRESKAPHCYECQDFGDLLCDWPAGKGKTCDLPMCEDHAHDLGGDKHLCEVHFRMFPAAGAAKVNVWPPAKASAKKGEKKR